MSNGDVFNEENDVDISDLDGYDVWESLVHGEGRHSSPRSEILFNIDPVVGEGAVRVGDYKLIVGADDDGWGPNLSKQDENNTETAAYKKETETGPWMFNVYVDPSERVNLYGNLKYVEIQKTLIDTLAKYNSSSVKCAICDMKSDVKAKPRIVPGLNICTPSPIDVNDPTKGSTPILCQDVGIWQPWTKLY